MLLLAENMKCFVSCFSDMHISAFHAIDVSNSTTNSTVLVRIIKTMFFLYFVLASVEIQLMAVMP